MSIHTAYGGYGQWKIKGHSNNPHVIQPNTNYREIFTDNVMGRQVVFEDITSYEEITVNASLVLEPAFIYGF